MAAGGGAGLARALTALSWLGLVVGGLLLGVAGALVQATTVSIAGRDVPWGLVATLVTLGVAVRGAVWVRRRRLGGVVVAVGWVVATLVLAQTGPGGDVLLPEGWRSQVYLVGGVIVAALAAGWPLPAGTGRRRPARVGRTA